MKIGQILSIDTILNTMIQDTKKTYKPKFLFWHKTTSQKIKPTIDNINESISNLKTPRLKEFEEKRGVMIETIHQLQLTEQEKQDQYKVDIEELKREYLEDIVAFEQSTKEFEDELLDEDSGVSIPKINIENLPSDLDARTIQVLLPVISIQGKPSAEIAFTTKEILSLLSYKFALKMSNYIAFIIGSAVDAMSSQIDKIDKLKKQINTHQEFGEWVTLKNRLYQETEEDKIAEINKELGERFLEIENLDSQLVYIFNEETKFTSFQITIDDLPDLNAEEFFFLSKFVKE